MSKIRELVLGVIGIILVVSLVRLIVRLILSWISLIVSWLSDNRWWIFFCLLIFTIVVLSSKHQHSASKQKTPRNNQTPEPKMPKRPPHLPPYNNKETRDRLFAQQKGRCKGCMTTTDYEELEIDHSHPRARWATYSGEHVDEPANLQLLCQRCNRSKGSKTMEEFERDRRTK